MTGECERDEGSRGMILVVVLWAIAMMTVIVVALSAFSQKNLSLAGVETDLLRSELALEAGLAVGGGVILGLKADDRVFLDGTPLIADIGNGRTVEVRVMDASALIDINRADPELIESLAAKLDLPAGSVKAIVDAIASLRKASSKEPNAPAEQNAATPAEPEEQKSPPPVLFAASELYGMEGVEAAAVDKLLPFITLYSFDGKVNPMAAPEVILDSIPGLTDSERTTLLRAAKVRQWKGTAVDAVFARLEKFLGVGESKTFVIGIRLIAGPGIIAGSRMTASVIVDEKGKSPFEVLAWSWY